VELVLRGVQGVKGTACEGKAFDITFRCEGSLESMHSLLGIVCYCSQCQPRMWVLLLRIWCSRPIPSA
jgi:hypothetical protein